MTGASFGLENYKMIRGETLYTSVIDFKRDPVVFLGICLFIRIVLFVLIIDK